MNVLIATESPQTRAKLKKLLQRQADLQTHSCEDAHTLQRQVKGAPAFVHKQEAGTALNPAMRRLVGGRSAGR